MRSYGFAPVVPQALSDLRLIPLDLLHRYRRGFAAESFLVVRLDALGDAAEQIEKVRQRLNLGSDFLARQLLGGGVSGGRLLGRSGRAGAPFRGRFFPALCAGRRRDRRQKDAGQDNYEGLFQIGSPLPAVSIQASSGELASSSAHIRGVKSEK